MKLFLKCGIIPTDSNYRKYVAFTEQHLLSSKTDVLLPFKPGYLRPYWHKENYFVQTAKIFLVCNFTNLNSFYSVAKTLASNLIFNLAIWAAIISRDINKLIYSTKASTCFDQWISSNFPVVQGCVPLHI